MTIGSSAPGIDAGRLQRVRTGGLGILAPTNDAVFGRITSRLVDPLLDAAQVGPGTRVLDIATGPGYAGPPQPPSAAQPSWAWTWHPR